MRLDLTGRHVEITPALEKIVDRQFAKLGRKLGDALVSAQVVLIQEKRGCVAEATVHVRGDHILRARGRRETWPQALSELGEKLEQQGERLKGKWDRRARGTRSTRPAARTAPRTRKAAAPGGAGERAGSGAGESTRPAPGRAGARPAVTRAGYDAGRRLTVDQAVDVMVASRDVVLVFLNAETDAINVLYRRTIRELDLIEPH